jgi:predicted ATP-grasp superfamily ATP-dependent carboligase
MQRASAVVCVHGMGINGLATVRSLGRRGIPVHVVAVKDGAQLASASRYCTGHTEIAEPSALPVALTGLGKTFSERPVLYVDNDAMIQLLAPHAAALKRHFRVVEPIGDAARLTDKAFQLRAAHEAGIPVPRTWFPASWAELDEIGRSSTRRLIAKPSPRRLAAGSNAPFKVLLCENAGALAEALRAHQAAPEDVLVQEYIEGDDSRIHAGLCYRANARRAFVLSVRKLRQTQPGAGVMAVGQVTDVPEVRDMTARLAETLGVRGVLCTEFKLDPTDGNFYFIEWNPRPAYFQSLGWKAGFDLAWLAYCDHVDPAQLPGDLAPSPSRHYWINFRGDLGHLFRVPWLALRPGTWAPYLRDKEWAVFAADDLAPWVRSLTQLGAALPRPIFRLKDMGSRLRGNDGLPLP